MPASTALLAVRDPSVGIRMCLNMDHLAFPILHVKGGWRVVLDADQKRVVRKAVSCVNPFRERTLASAPNRGTAHRSGRARSGDSVRGARRTRFRADR